MYVLGVCVCVMMLVDLHDLNHNFNGGAGRSEAELTMGGLEGLKKPMSGKGANCPCEVSVAIFGKNGECRM